jgi:hypothetical protein
MLESGWPMIDWVRRLLGEKHAPLEGAPPVRRLKTYSAESGYVYQYFYEGHRGPEYVFRVSSDRKTYHAVAVVLAADVLAAWERDRSRELNAKEQYAVAKLALLQAFDERSRPEQMGRPVSIRPADIDAIAERLGLL